MIFLYGWRRSRDSFSAEKPGWLRRATGTPPRAAFRIPLYKHPFQKTNCTPKGCISFCRREWDSFSAEKPRRLRRATGTPPRAAFRIPLYKFPCLHSKKPPARGGFCYVAERVGFEPTDTRISPVFKTGAFNHSTISPCFGGVYCNTNPAGGQSVFNREFCRKCRSRRCAIRSPEDTGRYKRLLRYFRGHIFCRSPADRFPFRPAQ